MQILNTRITELLGIEHPIVGGCMMHISDPQFVAEISNAGALGMMSSLMFPSEKEFRAAVQRVKCLTEKPFGINLSLLPAANLIDNEMFVRVIVEEGGVTVVETSGYRPYGSLLERLREAGIKTMHKCVSLHHALTAQALGVDAVTLFGQEGGGHIGGYGLSTMVLIPGAADALDIPVLAAGGIADGRCLAASLALGADGVVMGTRLLLTEECPIHPRIKEALLEAAETDTLPVLGSLGNHLRVWKNQASLRVAELEKAGADFADILQVVGGAYTREMLQTGDPDSGVIACSQGVGIMREIKPVAQVIRETVEEAATVSRRLIEGEGK